MYWVVNKAIATFWQLRRVVGATWGLNSQVMHWIYSAVVRPRVVYGAIVWWTGVEKATIRAGLTRVQRLAGLSITGAWSRSRGIRVYGATR